MMVVVLGVGSSPTRYLWCVVAVECYDPLWQLCRQAQNLLDFSFAHFELQQLPLHNSTSVTCEPLQHSPTADSQSLACSALLRLLGVWDIAISQCLNTVVVG